jgi:hypothetical protein
MEYAGAIYHVMSRGDRHDFRKTLEEASAKTSFAVHAYGLMTNHFRRFGETPEGNLADRSRLGIRKSVAPKLPAWRKTQE